MYINITKHKQLPFSNISHYILAILLILSCHTLVGTLIGGTRLLLICIGGTIVSVLLNIRLVFYLKKALWHAIILYFLIILLLLIGDFKYFYFAATYGVLAGLLFLGAALDDSGEYFYKVLHAFANVVLIIAAISLFFFLFGTIGNKIPPLTTYSFKEINWSNFDYNNYYFLYNDGQYTDIFGNYVLRNIGIFLEAPMYTLPLVLALYDFLFFRKSINWISIGILLFTMASTLSTTAYIFAALLLTIRFFEKIRNNTILKVIIAPIFTLILLSFVTSILSDKLSTTNLSGVARLDDIQASVHSFMKHPFLGNGYNNARALDPFRTSYTKNIVRNSREAGQSTGLFAIMSNGGLVYLSIWILPLIHAISHMKDKYSRAINYKSTFIIAFNILLLVTAIQTEYICVFFTVMCIYISTQEDIIDKIGDEMYE